MHKKAINLAHQGSHTGESGLERRLRYHFFFHGMHEKVLQQIQGCLECQMFVDKKTKELNKPHEVPSKNWEIVSVDLYGSMPSNKHVVVVQDLASRYPAARLVTSTKAEKVIPSLVDIYETLGNPDTQISDNDPPFNSRKMANFADTRDITCRFTAPYHPSSNPVETFMRPLGKTMKIGRQNGKSEMESLAGLLSLYRDTPHTTTGLPPANMLFRDGKKGVFPRKVATDIDIKAAKDRDRAKKTENASGVNKSEYRKKKVT